jgi:PKD repeat protein
VTSWQWDFGDPASGAANSSSDASPAHRYGSPGTYSVTLTVRDANGLTATTTHQVVVSMRTALAAAAVAAVVLLPASGAARPHPRARPWHPHVAVAARYAQQRRGIISFAVQTGSRTYGWHAGRIFPSASVLKAMLLVAYLRQGSVRNRALSSSDRALLAPMIRRSDNAAATAVLRRVGTGRLRLLARRAGMRRFTPVAGIWGNSQIDAEDQARYFYEIDRLIPPRHRRYGMALLAHVTPSQRWGFGRLHLPRGWRLYFKGGWGSGTGRVDHQVALLVHGRTRVSVAILTEADGTHAYGKETLRGVAARLLDGLHP